MFSTFLGLATPIKINAYSDLLKFIYCIDKLIIDSK